MDLLLFQSNLHFTKDMRITITSDVSNNNYIVVCIIIIHAMVKSLYIRSLLLTVHLLHLVNMLFLWNTLSRSDKLKLKVAELHEQYLVRQVVGSTLTETGAGTRWKGYWYIFISLMMISPVPMLCMN